MEKGSIGSASTEDSYDYIFKLIAVGGGGVGKTSLIRQFAHNKFSETYLYTLGVDFTTKQLMVGNIKVKIVCVDTAGQEYYSKLRPNYYLGANGGILTFDVTDRKTFNDIPKWLSEIQQYVKGVPIALVGNKIDLQENRLVTKEEAEKAAKDHNMLCYYETSAKLGIGVDQIFKNLATKILESYGIKF